MAVGARLVMALAAIARPAILVDCRASETTPSYWNQDLTLRPGMIWWIAALP